MRKNTPFFARFLEHQQVLSTGELQTVKAGGGEVGPPTQKWPSDSDEALAPPEPPKYD
jgi:hypothetical protein